jgi:hypothetical protein
MEIEVNDEIQEEEVLENEQEEVIEESETPSESEPETIQDEEEEDRIITIGDSAPEAEGEEAEDKETPKWVKNVRKSNRRLESENKRLKRELDESKTEIVKPVELGELPTLKGSNYDEEEFGKELTLYYERKRKVEAQAAETAKTVEDQNKSWQTRQEKYASLKKEHGFKDFSEAEDLVVNTFSQTQQGILVQGAKDSALLVYALGKNPKKLEELSKIKGSIEFAFAIATLETELKVTSRKAPVPEKRVSGGKAGGMSGNTDKTLERLREAADKSGDMTEVVAYKRKQKLKNKDS